MQARSIMSVNGESDNSESPGIGTIHLGCAGWSIPWPRAAAFPAGGSHLERYIGRFSAVEINTSFQRPHRPETYRRWAAVTPANFRFAVKMPRQITHKLRLQKADAALERFAGESEALGEKLGPWLVQLPPSLEFDETIACEFLTAVRRFNQGPVVCEPRHATWFTAAANELLAAKGISRVAADPAVAPEAGVPGGWRGLVYRRLHGSPKVYCSSYSDDQLQALATTLRGDARGGIPVWCIFDNTAEGAALDNALRMRQLN